MTSLEDAPSKLIKIFFSLNRCIFVNLLADAMQSPFSLLSALCLVCLVELFMDVVEYSFKNSKDELKSERFTLKLQQHLSCTQSWDSRVIKRPNKNPPMKHTQNNKSSFCLISFLFPIQLIHAL